MDSRATPQPQDPHASWLTWQTGQRVVVRRRRPEGGYTDVLGYLTEVTEDGVVVDTRRGPVSVPAADIALGKLVPPPPPPRGPRPPRDR